MPGLADPVAVCLIAIMLLAVVVIASLDFVHITTRRKGKD